MCPRATAFLPIAFALLTTPAVEEIAHGAAEDAEVVRTYLQTVELELVEFAMSFNGEEIPEEVLPDMEMTRTLEERVEVRDVYGPSGDGRPESLVRTYETLEGVDATRGTGPDGEDLDEELELSSELEGRTVVFTWDEDEEGYTAEFGGDDEDADEELLEDLAEDMDLRGFLPEGEVDVDDSWEVELEAFDQLAGGVDLVSGDEDPADEELDRQMQDNQDGAIEATFTGVREEEGVRVAVIWISADLGTFGEQIEDLDGARVSTEMTLALEVEGELLWNLDAGHLHGLALEGSIELETSITGAEEFEGESIEFAQDLVMSGPVEISIAVERE